MKDLAPQLTRQRLLIEAKYQTSADKNVVEAYLKELTQTLGLRTYGETTIHSPSGRGKAENQGYDAFIPLVDSGISLYIWTNKKFLSCLLYTCKKFSVDTAVEFTRKFWQTTDLEYTEF